MTIDAGNTNQHARRGRPRRKVILAISLSLVVILGGSAVAAAAIYADLSAGLTRSSFELPTPAEPSIAQENGETNILVMGLDSRVDQHGKPLPRELYAAIRAGNEDDGGYNANVLMLLHLPGDGSPAVGVSIPRDDYVELPGSPYGVSHSKIKEAYGLAFSDRMRQIRLESAEIDEEAAYQDARAAGRQSQIAAVSHFLGDVRIDHFIEVTMAGFYRAAEAVAPIRVCLNNDTEDAYSGARFAAGEQEIGAVDAMSFVRQRRDTSSNGVDLSDLDRTRRQQAFIVGLALKLKEGGTLSSIPTVMSLIDTAKQYIAVDDGFEPLAFLQRAAKIAAGDIRFVTLPVESFGTIAGKSVNLVDLGRIHTIVAELLAPASAEQPPTDSPNGTADGSTEPDPQTTDEAEAAQDEPESTSYKDWRSPLRGGAIPCVN